MNILINTLLAFEAVVAVLMMFVILMQRPKSEGLGAAFGGGVTENIFGAQTTNVLTTATTWLASIFFIVILVLSMLYAHKTMAKSAVRQELMKTSGAKTTAPAKASPLPIKAAARGAAADAKAELNPVPPAGVAPIQPASPVPADAAVGVVPPASAPIAPSGTPAASAQPTP
jgi:preprotein translocase subunit SecG